MVHLLFHYYFESKMGLHIITSQGFIFSALFEFYLSVFYLTIFIITVEFFLGVCLGFQIAVIEFAREVLGWKGKMS